MTVIHLTEADMRLGCTGTAAPEMRAQAKRINRLLVAEGMTNREAMAGMLYLTCVVAKQAPILPGGDPIELGEIVETLESIWEVAR
jgi:hypothetical protein